MFWRGRLESKLERMNILLQRSFSNVKNDATTLFQWIQYLYHKSQEQEALIKNLNEELSAIPKSPQQIKHIMDSYYSYEGILAQIKRLNERVDGLLEKSYVSPQQNVNTNQTAFKELEQRLQKLENKKLSLKEKIIKRLTKNSKEYVKSVIISFIRKYELIPALQLKEMIVDDQRLCSKSSFYRILEEIENLNEVGIIKKGKEKHYFYKVIKNV